MFDKEEQQLREIKDTLHEAPMPPELDLHIQLGISRAKKQRRRRTYTRAYALAAAVLFVALVASVRVSPVMASYVAQIPGMQSVVDLIRWDHGVKRAIDHDMMQPISDSDTQLDIKLEVHHIIADASRMLVFYELTGPEELDMTRLEMDQIELIKPDGSKLEEYGGLGITGNVDNPDGFSSYLDFTFNKPMHYPEFLTLQATFRLAEEHDGKFYRVGESSTRYERPSYTEMEQVWSIKLPIDVSKTENMAETYAIDQTVTIDGQRITFEKLNVHPTRMELFIAYDPDNTKKIFSYDDLHFEDENGVSYGPITNGVVGSPLDEHHAVLYYQSSYFAEAKELYLVGSSATALDKDKLEVQVDLDTKKLLSRPDDRLSLLEANQWPEGLELKFNLRNDHPLDEKHMYNVFSHQLTDANGTVVDSNSSGTSSTIDGGNDMYVWFPLEKPLESPVTLTINRYPTRIEEAFRVRVK